LGKICFTSVILTNFANSFWKKLPTFLYFKSRGKKKPWYKVKTQGKKDYKNISQREGL
jgi:hypothetical protein